MTNRLLDIMNARYAYLESTIRSLENKRVSCPEGTINIRPNPSGFSYIWHIETTHKYLNRNNTELIRLISHLISAGLTTLSKRTSAKSPATFYLWYFSPFAILKPL